MPAQPTLPCSGVRRTEVANHGAIDPADKLYAVVKAFNVRAQGKSYDAGAPEALFDAIKAFNTRRLGLA